MGEISPLLLGGITTKKTKSVVNIEVSSRSSSRIFLMPKGCMEHWTKAGTFREGWEWEVALEAQFPLSGGMGMVHAA